MEQNALEIFVNIFSDLVSDTSEKNNKFKIYCFLKIVKLCSFSLLFLKIKWSKWWGIRIKKKNRIFRNDRFIVGVIKSVDKSVWVGVIKDKTYKGWL